jgi:hypothetical protein
MPSDLRSLPPEVAEAARRAREQVGTLPRVPVDLTPLGPEIAEWAREMIETGELNRAIARVAASDPDLAS